MRVAAVVGTVMRRGPVLVAALLAAAFAPALTARADTWQSTDGLYRLVADSELKPLAINRLHSWTLTLTDADGQPVEGAEFTVTGGMPEHNHGLPTAPRMTRYLGEGRYLVEGMRFHMQGYWELSVAVTSALGSDTVLMHFDVSQ